MNLKTTYLGIELENPVIASSSPFTNSLDKIMRLEDSGIGAVVLKSVFEEQIMGEAAYLQRYNNYAEAADYLRNYLEQDYLDGHLKLIKDIKEKTSLPVIASINCQSADSWVEYVKLVESAGADAVELNVFILPASTKQPAKELEKQYIKTIINIIGKIGIPVSVKLSMRFTNVLSVCRELYFRRVAGVVMFNRLFEPDFDIDDISMVSSQPLSDNSELRNVLRTVGMCTPKLPVLDIAVSSGVHSGADVVKSILAGAKAAQICTALYLHGMPVIAQMKKFLSEWMEAHGFESPESFRGILSYKDGMDTELYQRTQYMKFMPKK